MKLIILLFTSLIFLVDCTGNQHNVRYNYHSHKTRIKPSESSQISLPKETRLRRNSESFILVENYNESKSEVVEDKNSVGENISSDGSYRGYFKIGNPYEIFGVSYIPQDYESFEERGISSWYGDDFHGKETANGEIYNMEEMTAAHRTLPLPSLIRVTNLKNSKSVIVRVNDRGPFAKGRIIDVSEKAAINLGFRDNGTTEVKIELLRNETDELLEKLKLKEK
jgi:rare lipoprotein A